MGCSIRKAPATAVAGNRLCPLGVLQLNELSGEAQVTDAELIVNAREGNNAAWEELVRDHQQSVFRLAYLLVADAEEAEDIAQETFIHAYHALGRFEASRPIRPWLLAITTNLARNNRRSVGRYLRAVRKLIQTNPPAVVESSTCGMDTDAVELYSAVRSLGRADREVILMRYFLDLSEQETAEALGIARGTVKSRLSRALVRLREVVERDYPDLVRGREL